ncbi:MAG: TonB-dependent receptor [Acidobacteriia bacterium]|nr:TonB-dependent receptor [Terriglobia bacterium]
MKSRRLSACWCGLLLALALTQYAAAQATISYALLNGTVTDEAGRTIAQAKITVRSLDTNQTFTATSNDTGFYALPSLPPGRYELSVNSAGFGQYTRTGVVVTVGQTATINVTLKVAAVKEEVVVNTEAPAVETTRSEVSQVIDTKQINNLPISGRLFTDFALLTPSVATSRTSLGTTFTEFEITQISFGGMRSFSNEITVDGADFVNTISGVQRATPPQDSVQEFRVVNNSFGAEYGRALGGIVNIQTKSGTNDLHGSIYDYLQNSATDARSLLQPAPLPHALRENQFGGTLGGPVQKDKTFFFLNYEAKRRGASPTYAPSLFANIDAIDQAKGYLGLSPEGCSLKPDQCTGTPFSYLQGVLKTVDNDYGFARLDHQINNNNRFALRYVVEDARDLGELIGNTEDGGGIGTPSGARNLFIRDQSLVGTLNSVLRPNLVNTVLGQYSRRHYNFPGATGEPNLDVVNDLSLGHNFGTYDAIYESRSQYSDSLSWVKGNHVAKFGFDGNYVWSYNNYPGFTPERLLFPNLDCAYAFADTISLLTTGTYGTVPQNCQALEPGANGLEFIYFGLSLPRAGFANGYQPSPATGGGFGSGWPNAFPTDQYSNYAYTLNHGYWGFFAQDQWRITPKLTVNYGLRWDYESGLSSTANPDYLAFQPRIGFAYSPDSKTVIRAGFGTFYDRNNLTFFFTTGNQKTLPGYFCNPPGADPNCAANGFSQGVVVPMIHQGAQNGGWQLSAAPGAPATPSLPCPVLGLPPSLCSQLPGTPEQQTISVEVLQALSILAGGPMSYPTQSLTGPCTADPITGAPTGACGVGSGGIQKNGRLPYAEQGSLQIDRQIGKGLTIEAGYLFVGAHKLVRGNNLNIDCPYGTAKASNPYYAQGLLNPDGSLTACSGTPALGPFGLGPFFAYLGPAANPGLPIYNPLLPVNPSGLEFGVPGGVGAPPTLSGGLLDYNNNVANAVYHGLTFTAMERLKYFRMTANYTYSHTIDNGNFTTFINLPVNQYDYGNERANSNQDLRHNFVANFTATAPDHTFLRNFELSGIITVQSGRPFTLFVGQNTFGDVAGLSTDRVGGPPVVASCPSVTDCTTTVRRNTYTGAPFRSVDLRLSRNFRVGEGKRLDFAVDAFNLFNHPNVDEVSSVYGSPAFCGASPAIPKHYNDATTLAIQHGDASVSCATQQAAGNPGAWLSDGLLPVGIPGSPNPTFGKPRTVFNPRQLQFSLKFSF